MKAQVSDLGFHPSPGRSLGQAALGRLLHRGPNPYRRRMPFEEIDDGRTVWRFETDFLGSNWTCVWGNGCLGILPEPAEELQQGCCSVGADLGDEDEAMMISAMAA